MEENISSTTLIDISRYCSSLTDGDYWPSSQSSFSPSPVQRLFSLTPTRSADSDSPVLPGASVGWPLSSAFANIDLDPPLWSSNISVSSKNSTCNCCHCGNKMENLSEKLQNRIKNHLNKDGKQTVTPIQRPSPARTTIPSSSLNIFDDEDDNDDDGTLRLHVSNIPFTWSKEKLAEVFGKYGTTFDVEVVYNERGSKGFGFVTFLAKKDALEAKRRMDREIVDGRRLVVNFAKPKQKTSGSSKEHTSTNSHWKTSSSSDRSNRAVNNNYQSLGFSTPPTARRQHLSGFSSLSSTPTRPTTTNNYHRYYL